MPDPITLGIIAVAGVGGVASIRASDNSDAAPDGPNGADPQQRTAGSDGTSAPVVLSYSTEVWRPIVTRLCGDQPAEFHMAWIQVESAGNPASVGSIHANGPDGYALEMGIYQLYNPDELRLAGTTSSALRPSYAMAKGGSQSLLAALTSDDMDVQVQAGVAYIAKRRARADSDLAAVGASWSERDIWRLVKCYHALGGLPRAALQGYLSTNGSGPADWQAFRDFAATADLSPWIGAKAHNAYKPYTKVLNNAEKVGGVVAD